MQVVLRQTFTLGRFHATPWKVFPYDDPHGEWPPSPWRLLRAIVARSYQFERERPPIPREQREGLVAAFCGSEVSWRLPEFSWRGPGLRQYQPVEFKWANPTPKKLKLIPLDQELSTALGGRFAVLEKGRGDLLRFEVFDEERRSVRLIEDVSDRELVKSFKEARRRGTPVELRRYPPDARGYSKSKVQDNIWLIPDGEELLWFLTGDLWERQDMDLLGLLDACLARMTYFGRAESITEIGRVREPSVNLPVPNCYLSERRGAGMVPVLVPVREATLGQVEASTDDKEVAGATIPPGTRWMYAERPLRPAPVRPSGRVPRLKPVQLVQFAIGSHVPPGLREIVRLTQRFRGRALRAFLERATNGTVADWGKASLDLRERARLLTGKDSAGGPLRDHSHAVFFVHVYNGKPARLCMWRRESFDDAEQTALLAAAEAPLPLGYTGDPWTVTLVPMDSLVPPPPPLSALAHDCWETATPFVPPRHVLDRRGHLKHGESVEDQVRGELANRGIDPANVGVSIRAAGWVKVNWQPRRWNRSGAIPTAPTSYLSR